MIPLMSQKTPLSNCRLAGEQKPMVFRIFMIQAKLRPKNFKAVCTPDIFAYYKEGLAYRGRF